MFQVRLSFFPNLLNVFPVRLPNVSVNILLLFRWFQSLPVLSYICCISVHKMLYCSLFSAAFCITFPSAGIVTYVSLHAFPFFFLIISGLLLSSSSSSSSSSSPPPPPLASKKAGEKNNLSESTILQ